MPIIRSACAPCQGRVRASALSIYRTRRAHALAPPRVRVNGRTHATNARRHTHGNVAIDATLAWLQPRDVRPLTLALLEYPHVILAHVLARHPTAVEGAIAHCASGYSMQHSGSTEPRERSNLGNATRRRDDPRVQHHGRLAGARHKPLRRRAAIGRTARAVDLNRAVAPPRTWRFTLDATQAKVCDKTRMEPSDWSRH